LQAWERGAPVAGFRPSEVRLWYRSYKALKRLAPKKPMPKPVPPNAFFTASKPVEPQSQQPIVSTSATNPSPISPAAPVSAQPELRKEPPPPRIPRWLQQVERFLRVIVRIYLGLLVCFAPWYPPAWDNNPLFMSSPTVMGWVTSGAVRGIVSGLGLLNLWIALRDAIQPPDSPQR